MSEPEVTETLTTALLGATRTRVHEWSVEVVGGPDKGLRVTTLDSLVRVGSDPSNDIVLSDPTVSRQHLEVERTPRGLLLKDLGSRNGTWLDGRDVLQARLQAGDKFTLGKTKLLVRQETRQTEVELLGADSFGDLAGVSEKMRAVFAELRRIAREETHLLLEGETGTGKELAARAVHGHSVRRHGPFRIVDCNLVTEEAAERELFGSTDASGVRTPGAFEAAAGGTVFLDEVGELPAAVQPKLLRVLDSGEINRPGEPVRPLDARVIASTHHNLDEEVRQGRFRADLYFRLAVAKVRLPPLRTRRDDLPVLSRQIVRAFGQTFELDPQTQGLFESYDWPGNVRELRNVLERASLMRETGTAHWLDFLPTTPRDEGVALRSGDAVLAELAYHEAKDRVLAEFERVYFAEVMRTCNYDIALAEARTGLSQQSLYRLLKKNGLRLKDLKNAEGLDK